VIRESIPMIANDPDFGMRAFEQARLGKVLLRSGDLDGAEKSFRETERLFHDVPAGKRRDTLSAEAELGLAKAQMERGNPRVAVNLLERVGSVIDKVPEDDLRLDYLETSGIASLHAGDLAAAQSKLDASLELTEKGLRLVHNEDDRMTWSRRNALAYRAMVELTLRTDPTRALAYWEWYKGASLRGGSRPPSPHMYSRLAAEQSTIPPGTAVLSYIFFENRAVVWVWDSHGIRERQIDASEATLDVAVRRFIEHCSDQNSNIETLRQESAEIYRQILLPIEPWLTGKDHLIFEPDGILRSLPLEALVDAKGQYLNDRFAVTVSPGMEYLTVARKWVGISAASAAFVLGDPVVPGWPPLPDAEQEARTVAANFTHPHLSLRDDIQEANIAREISNAEVFHFSGHGSAGALSTGLVVGENGLFDAWKMGVVDHGHNQLVVLSACDTSSGTGGAFDDEDSLVEQLVSAGVPAVVASRWPVDSAATAALMSNFYSKLLTGETVSEASRSAGIEMRSTRLFAHPFFWAGFAVFGRV
jgi:CHAT domain-containing protein